jgi:large subunit ribosomal protein L23
MAITTSDATEKVFRVIRRPIITEKGLGVKETQHTVVFEVAKDATKTEIKEAVQRVFKVKVDHVRTAIYHGKFRRRGRAEGFRSDWKKAYVRLAPGEKMIEYAENL